jgi:hypothetical protein
MSMTVRIRGNISKTSTGKYSGDVTIEFTEDNAATATDVDFMEENLKLRLRGMADWMDKELKARGGE